jgi:hypothetical protein
MATAVLLCVWSSWLAPWPEKMLNWAVAFSAFKAAINDLLERQ